MSDKAMTIVLRGIITTILSAFLLSVFFLYFFPGDDTSFTTKNDIFVAIVVWGISILLGIAEMIRSYRSRKRDPLRDFKDSLN